MQKQFIGLTWHAGYFSKCTDISISDIDNGKTVKIYLVPSEEKRSSIENIDITKLQLICEKKVETGKLETYYDSSNYESDSYRGNEKFKLLVDGQSVHATQYMEKYLIGFDGSFVLKDTKHVDH